MEFLNKNRIIFNLLNLKNFDFEIIFDIILFKIECEMENNKDIYKIIKEYLKSIINLNDDYLLKFKKINEKINLKKWKNPIILKNMDILNEFFGSHIIEKHNINEKVKSKLNIIKITKNNIKSNYYNIIKNLKIDKNKLSIYNNDILKNIEHYKNLKNKVNKFCKDKNLNQNDYDSVYNDSIKSLNNTEIKLVNKIHEKNNYKRIIFNNEKNLLTSIGKYVSNIKDIQSYLNEIKISNFNSLFSILDEILASKNLVTLKYKESNFDYFFGKKINMILNFISKNPKKILFLKNLTKILNTDLFNYISNWDIDNNDIDLKFWILKFNFRIEDIKFAFNFQEQKILSEYLKNDNLKSIFFLRLNKMSLSNIEYKFKFRSNVKYITFLIKNIFKIEFFNKYNIKTTKFLEILNAWKYEKYGNKNNFLSKIKDLNLFINITFWEEFINLNIDKKTWFNKILNKLNNSKDSIIKIEILNKIIKILILCKVKIIKIYELINWLNKDLDININDIHNIYKNYKNLINENIREIKIKRIHTISKYNVDEKKKLKFILKSTFDYLTTKDVLKWFILKKKIFNKNTLYKYLIINNNFEFSHSIYFKIFQNFSQTKINNLTYNNFKESLEEKEKFNILKKDLKRTSNKISAEDQDKIYYFSVSLLKKLDNKFSYFQGLNFIISYLYLKIDDLQICYNFLYNFIKIYITKYIDKTLNFWNKIFFLLNNYFKIYFKKLYYEFKNKKINLDMFITQWILTLFTYFLDFNNYKDNMVIKEIIDIFIIKSWDGLISIILVIWGKVEKKLYNKNFEEILKIINSSLNFIINEDKEINLKKEINNYKITKKFNNKIFNEFYNKQQEEEFFWSIIQQ